MGYNRFLLTKRFVIVKLWLSVVRQEQCHILTEKCKKCKTDAYFRLHFIIKKLVPLNKLLTLRLFSIFVTEKRRTKFQYYFKENIFKVLRYFNLGAKLWVIQDQAFILCVTIVEHTV